MLVDIVVAVFLERTTPKTSRNSGLPSSRDGTDDGQTHTEGKSGSRSRGPKARHARSDNLRTVTTTHTSAVTGCRQCSHTLYRCLDKLLIHKRAFFSFLCERWETHPWPSRVWSSSGDTDRARARDSCHTHAGPVSRA